MLVLVTISQSAVWNATTRFGLFLCRQLLCKENQILVAKCRLNEHAELLQQVQQRYHKKKKNITKKLFPTKQTMPETRQHITPRLILVVNRSIWRDYNNISFQVWNLIHF